MNDPSQHEFDELLSAYLDDELSTAERALVETRLAADPAARQTLEQLRSVSQSLRDLPTQSIGHDLRDSILRRAEASKPKASRGVPAASPNLPGATIGRTRRGWVWASLAVAAALLIMVFQPGSEQNADLPNVALSTNKDESVAINRQLSEKSLEELAVDKAESPAAAMPQSTPSSMSSTEQSASAPQQVAQGRAAGSRSESLDTPAANGRPAADTFAAQAPAEMSELKSAAPAPALPPGASQQLVVHVLTNRTAFENNAFDTLLRENGVNFETSTQSFDASGRLTTREPATNASSGLEPQATGAPTDGEKSDADAGVKVDTDADVEVVLVDAPSSTIFSCMDALNKDATNYLGVSVEDPSATEELAAVETPQSKKLATDMGKFNRGVVPQQQDKLTREQFYFFQSGDGNELRFSRGQRFGGGLGGGSGEYGIGQKEEARTLGTETAKDLARARRLQPQERADRVSQEQSSNVEMADVSPTTDATIQREKMSKLHTSATASPERMQVLFVLRPSDDPAPSLKAKNQAE